MENSSNQERVWVLGAFATITAIVVSCVVGGVFSAVGIGPILAFGAMISATVVNTLTNKLAALKADANARVAATKVEEVSIVAKIAAQSAGIAAVKAEEAAVLVQENAAHADERAVMLTDIAHESLKIGKTNHELLNSAKGELLAEIATLSRRVASLTGDADDGAAAEQKEKVAANHAASQAAVVTPPVKKPPPPAPSSASTVKAAVEAAQETAKTAQSTAQAAQETAKAAQETAKNITEKKETP